MRIDVFVRKNGELIVQFKKDGKLYSLSGESAKRYIRSMSRAREVNLFEGKERVLVGLDNDSVYINKIERIRKQKRAFIGAREVLKTIIVPAENLSNNEKYKLLHGKYLKPYYNILDKIERREERRQK